jgi:hypothetical protein
MLEFGLVCDFIQARDDFIQATLRPNLGVPMMSHPRIRPGLLGITSIQSYYIQVIFSHWHQVQVQVQVQADASKHHFKYLNKAANA